MVTTTGPFKLLANQYRDLGFNPVPIRPGSKSPAPSGWQTGRQPDETFNNWIGNYETHGLGVLCGTPLEALLNGGVELRGQYLIAVDVDRDDMSEPVRHALRVHEKNLCAKRGKKGLTIFVRGDSTQVNKKISRREEDGRRRTLVEILAAGSQTVIPPTIHPDTNEPYKWIGADLMKASMRTLPEINDSVMDEIMAVCEGGARSEHFDNLRTMTWAGVGGGGNTHDTCVSAVASMVARNWKDTQIHERIEFAKKEACIKAGMAYDWPGSARTIQEWIDSARKKGMDESPADKKASQDRIAAAWLIEQYGGSDSCRYMGKNLLTYRDGYWADADEPRAMERKILEHFRGMNALRARSSVDTALSLVWDSRFGHTEHGRFLVCTRDGTLDARSLRTERWNPEHELLFQAKAVYGPGVTCPRYESFIHGMLGGDQEKIDVLEEFLGWTFVQDTSFEKALFIVGRSGIGKSTLMHLLESMHGDGAISHVAPQDISEPTARAGLVGKLVNVSSEKSRIKSISDDFLKKIVSGEAIEVRRLYQDFVTIRPVVRFINTVNDMPDMADYSDGLARRLLILICLEPFTPSETEKETRLLLQLQAERDGIFTKWMVALNRLIQQDGFRVPASVKGDVASYIEASSMTAIWMQERCSQLAAQDGKAYTSNDELYQDFSVWVESRVGGERWKHLSIISWGKELKSLGFPSVTQRRGEGYTKARRLALKNQRRRGVDPTREPGY